MTAAPDIRAIMDEIRSRVSKDVEAFKDRGISFSPYNADGDARAQSKAGELVQSEELRYLNHHYAYGANAAWSMEGFRSHRFGPLGWFIVFSKRIVAKILCRVLKEYFEKEREFNANLVRFLNATSKYIDSRDASNFWELIRKIDVDSTRILERVERVGDEANGTVRSAQHDMASSINTLASNLNALNQRVASLQNQVNVIESVSSGLESIVARYSKQPSLTASSAASMPDQSYLLLENRFRGSEALISERLSLYPKVFKGAPGAVLEIGGGRGELQMLFKQAGVSSYSVDVDQAMVDAAKEKGVDARHGDGIAHLESLPDQSLGGVIAVQVVEHLPWKVLGHLFELCTRKVKSGGVVVFETINPRSVMALSSNYFRDPTHVWPLHPDTLSYQMSLAGLQIERVELLSEVPHEAGIQEVAIGSHMSPRWAGALVAINRNFKRLHELLYGHQDYAVIARVR